MLLNQRAMRLVDVFSCIAGQHPWLRCICILCFDQLRLETHRGKIQVKGVYHEKDQPN